jgi:hypothetical protein
MCVCASGSECVRRGETFVRCSVCFGVIQQGGLHGEGNMCVGYEVCVVMFLYVCELAVKKKVCVCVCVLWYGGE